MNNKKSIFIFTIIISIIISSFLYDISKPQILIIPKSTITNNINDNLNKNIEKISNTKSNFVFITNIINTNFNILNNNENILIKAESKLDFIDNKIILNNKSLESSIPYKDLFNLNINKILNDTIIFSFKENNTIIELNYLKDDIHILYSENNYFIKDLYLLYLSAFIVLISILLSIKYFYDIIFKIKENDLINSIKG